MAKNCTLCGRQINMFSSKSLKLSHEILLCCDCASPIDYDLECLKYQTSEKEFN